MNSQGRMYPIPHNPRPGQMTANPKQDKGQTMTKQDKRDLLDAFIGLLAGVVTIIILLALLA